MNLRTQVVRAPFVILLVAIAGCSRTVENADHVAGIQALMEGTPAWVEKGRLGTRLWKIEQQSERRASAFCDQH